MKYLILSDFHGNISAYKKLPAIADKIKPDGIIFLGDNCDGNGAYPVNNVLDKIFYPLQTVVGNCDHYSIVNSLNVGILGNSETREDNGKTLFFTHGHLYNNYSLPPVLKEGDIFFYGHYHFPDISINHGVYCVCVGSMGRPRAGSDQSYCVYENGIIRLISAEKDTVLVEIDTNKN